MYNTFCDAPATPLASWCQSVAVLNREAKRGGTSTDTSETSPALRLLRAHPRRTAQGTAAQARRTGRSGGRTAAGAAGHLRTGQQVRPDDVPLSKNRQARRNPPQARRAVDGDHGLSFKQETQYGTP